MFKFGKKDFGRNKPTNNNSSSSNGGSSWFPSSGQHPGGKSAKSKGPTPRPQTLHRSSSVNERGSGLLNNPGDRRSIAAFPHNHDYPVPQYPPEENGQAVLASQNSALGRAQTVLRKENGGNRSGTSSRNYSPVSAPDPAEPPVPSSQQWTPDFAQLPTPNEFSEDRSDAADSPMPMSSAHHNYQQSQAGGSTAAGKASTDSGQQAVLDRWSQRRLQRLQTESAFRETRQTGGVSSPQVHAIEYNNNNAPKYADAQPHSHAAHHSSQAAVAAGGAAAAGRTGQPTSTAGALQGLAIHTPDTGLSSRSNSFPMNDNNATSFNQTPPLPALSQAQIGQNLHAHHQSQLSQHHQQQVPFSPHDAAPPQFSHPPASSIQEQQQQQQQQQASSRPSLSQHQSRSFAGAPDDSSMSNNGSTTLGPTSQQKPPSSRTSSSANRQSVHNALGSSVQGIVPGLPPTGPNQTYKTSSSSNAQDGATKSDGSRGTLTQAQDDGMSEEEVAQLMREYKELREKYTKVKKYYFEKEDQVKHLQNSLAHQRLSQSRTSLDDSEYTTRFNRLDGLVAQLSFSIRKSWRSIPAWLSASVNKDAVATGKQEMTAAGRAFISCWLVEEVFERFFHPDLDVALSTQLKAVQKNIRRNAPTPANQEEEEALTSKIVNWRLATLEGLHENLRSPNCATNRQNLTDTLKDALVAAISVYLQDPAPADLEGGVHMIIELVISIAIHLPLESRDVVIEYFAPGTFIQLEQMRVEAGGIPALTLSIADDQAERASLKSAGEASDVTDWTDAAESTTSSKKGARAMLSALTGGAAKQSKSAAAAAQGKHASTAGGSSSSLHRPESAQGAALPPSQKEDLPPRVRMAAGMGVSVRGRAVLVKAPVFGT